MSHGVMSLLRDAAQRPAGWLARAGRLGRGFGGIEGIRGMGETATANGNGRLIREGTRRGAKKGNSELQTATAD